MRGITAVALFVSLALAGFARAEDGSASPVGYWKTTDDASGKANSIVKIFEVDGELRGRIEKLLDSTPGDDNPFCVKCPDDKKNAPILGLGFLGGFKKDGDGWSDGWVLDPDEGRTYHANLEVIDGGKRLKLFGYVRVLFKIGRSQTWERVSPEEYGLTDK